MNELSTIDSQYNNGRKGLSYDWHSLIAAGESSALDAELAELTPLSTTSDRA